MTIKHALKDEQNYFHYRVKKSEHQKYIMYQTFIRRYLQKKDPKLLKIFNRYTNFSIFLEAQIGKEYKQDHSIKVEKTCKYFLRIRQYNQDAVNYDFQDLITDVVLDLQALQFQKGSLSKKDFIHFCFTIMRNLINEWKGFESCIKLNHYQKGTITAYLTMLWGYEMTTTINESYIEGQDPSTTELYDAVKTAIKRFDQKKKKR